DAARSSHDQVWLAVAVNVDRRHRERLGARAEGPLDIEAGPGGARGGGVEQHRDRVVDPVRRDQVGLAVTVDVGRRHRDREAARGDGNGDGRLCDEADLTGARGCGVEQHRDRVAVGLYRKGAVPIRHDQVRLAVAVDVGHRHRDWARVFTPGGVESLLAGEAGRGGSRGGSVEQYRDRAAILIRHDQVGLAVTVEVSRRHRGWGAARVEGLLSGEAGRGSTRGGSVEQYRDRAAILIRHDQVRLAVAVDV